MLRNCVILVHTNMLDATHLVQINMPVSFLSNMRFGAKNLLKKNKTTWLHKTMQIQAKIGFMLPRHANSVKNEDSGFRPEVQKRGNSHIKSTAVQKKMRFRRGR